MSKKATPAKPTRRRRGFERASSLVSSRVSRASESRGFAVSRLLTHWADVAGPDVARIARPVDVAYGRGFGATLTLLTTGANAPMLEMQKEAIRARVNACYGYAAIQKVRITQTAATGFAEGQVVFGEAAEDHPQQAPIQPEARAAARDVANDDLRQALERLGSNVLTKSKS
ncbi:MAG: DciA family protein [Silicimonas sp.]|nr:DciA family protein [Silicimonas sp.]